MLTLRDLQLQVEAISTIEETRLGLTEVFKFYSSQPDNRKWVNAILSQTRSNTVYDIFPDEDILFYNEEYYESIDIPEEHLTFAYDLYDLKKFKQPGRLIYPVRDVNGLIAGFTGWDPTSEYKYLNSKTYGFRVPYSGLYGMENLFKYYTSEDVVFVVEGIACCNYLRSKGFNSLALLGSYITPYNMDILKRFSDRLVYIADNDDAGIKVANIIKKEIPSARVYKSLLAKDVDDTRVIDESSLLSDLTSLTNPFSLTRVLVVV